MLNRTRFAKPYIWTIIAMGTAVCIFSAYRLPLAQLDLRFLLVAVITLGITSRISIRIPQFKSEISVSDTFIFLIMLLYGGEAAILLAAGEALFSSLRFSKKISTILFNATGIACSTFLTAWTLRLSFGKITDLPHADISANLMTAVCLMALTQYFANSGVVAMAGALKSNQPIWHTWRKHFLWTSITYVAGALAAGILAKLIEMVGIYIIILTTPIVAAVYFTYLTYLKNVESAAAQAEQAERHVAELSHYIAEQERIREQFTQIEKLSALGELASGVAHDFNNTLAGILGRAQLMLRTSDPEKIKRGLQIIIKAAEDGAKTVKRIQDFARQRRDHDFEQVVVSQLLFDVSEMTRPRWKDHAEANNVHISLDLQIRSHAMILGDDSELREVLVNMVFNATDAMPEGGKLTLATSEVDGFVEISISDTGKGMTPEVRSRIFDPFFTTKGNAGLGLGLAVSYGIIRRHEGTIEVESEVGQGTTFRIRLPIAQGMSQAAPALQPAPVLEPALEPLLSVTAPPRLQQPRILVVDDEAPIRELLSEILESEDYKVTTAAGGREALALFNAQRFDAIFTDIGMPGMSGWELAHAIREQNASIPLAVITGWGEAVGSNEQKAAGVDWVVTKPFTAGRIIELAHESARRSKSVPDRQLVAAA